MRIGSISGPAGAYLRIARHGSFHRWPLIAEALELAPAINSASRATSTVERKGDCKGSLVTEYCVTQVYYASSSTTNRLFVPVSREGYTTLLHWRTTDSSSVPFTSVAILQGIIKSRLLRAFCCRLSDPSTRYSIRMAVAA